MSDFAPGGPEIPSPPLEIPTPDFPPPNFVEIGKQFADGMATGGKADKVLGGWLDWIGALVAKIIAAALNLVLDTLAALIRLVFQGLHLGESGMDQLMSQVVSGVTGVPTSPVNFAAANDRGSRESVASGVVSALQAALGTGQPGAGAGPLVPSSAGAEAFLKFTTHMAIEGWLLGVVCDAVSVHELEQVGELKEVLEQSLGLSRLARRALAAPMKILVEDPYTWLLNQEYRPALPAMEMLVREYVRGKIDRSELDRIAGYHGYAPQFIEEYINMNKAHLSAGDIETLRLHGDLDDPTATQLLKDQGYDDSTAASAQRALGQGRHDTWARQLVTEALTGLEKRFITSADFDQYLNNSGLPADERAILTLYANLKLQFSRKRFSVAEGQQLVEKGLWTLDQFRTLVTELGYTPEDETDLELLTLGKLADQAAAAAAKKKAADAKAAATKARSDAAVLKAQNATAAAEAKGVSLARFEALILDGKKTLDQYAVFLKGKGVALDNITALVSVLQVKIDKAAAAAAATPGLSATAKAKHVDLAQLEQATLSGNITISEYQTRVEALGFSPEDSQLLVDVLQTKLDAAAAKASAKAELAAKARAKNVNLAEEQRGARTGLVTEDQYRAFLAGLGFSSESVDLLDSEMQAQITADAAARQQKQSVQAALKQRGVSLGQLEQAVRAGVSTIDDYRAALAKAGYATDAQDQLVSLLQLRMDQDQATLAAKGHAAALLDKSGLSLVEIERAVKLGVVPMSTYTAALRQAGVSDTDAQVLQLSLAAGVKTTKAAGVTKATVAKQLSEVGLNLAKMEQDILDGRFTVAQLGAVLSGAGISADAQTAISQLISDEVANQQHLAQLEGKANAAAGLKGLSLAQEEAAVKAGVKTIEEFRAFLATLNFSQPDIDTLASTIQAKLKTPSTTPVTPVVP